MITFVSGSMSINRLTAEMKSELDKVTEVIVGDAFGVDSLVQKYCDKNDILCTVYHMGPTPRNNIGIFPTKEISVSSAHKDREYFTEKDIAMTQECDEALVFWDGESLGTATNIQRVKEAGKPVKVIKY